jgi:hypothetical protein
MATTEMMMLSEAPQVKDPSSHACFDLQQEWKQACDKAMGFQEAPPPENKAAINGAPTIHILNLLQEDTTTILTHGSNITVPKDAWLENANQIAASISQMNDMIKRNERGYVTGDLSNEEASVLESTVLSFSATAANQIDSLRAAMDSHHHSMDYVQSCSGIVACLLLYLRELVANPMAVLQKQRSRTAMTIYQHPLACRLADISTAVGGKNVWDQLTQDDDDGEPSGAGQKFRPQQAAPIMSTNFMAAYASTDATVLSRPTSLFAKRKSTTSDETTIQQPPAKHVKFTNKQPQVHEERMAYQQEMQVQEETQQELQKEAVLLEASLQNDLDSVHQVEQSMTQITALLSQFATLVSEQQEEVVAIHDTTLSSKQNVVKGQESLIDAKERTKKSKHYMATLVWAVAMILLFFNWITP